MWKRVGLVITVFLKNVGIHKTYMAPHPRRRRPSQSFHSFINLFVHLFISTDLYYYYLIQILSCSCAKLINHYVVKDPTLCR
jgi:hypothetical protein